MKVLYNTSLKSYNTFGIDVKAKTFVEITSEKELIDALDQFRDEDKLVLGGGSNMLLTKDVESVVFHLNSKGKEILKEDENTILVKASAGENWHSLVLWCIEKNYGGLENLSLIPGNVGTSPIQNIGAYGVELKDVFYSCEAIHTKTLKKHTFSKEECKFGYRESIFKTTEKGNYIITNVTFQLTKKNHTLNTSYGVIEEVLTQKNIASPTIKDISDAVISIRQSKLPDPKEIGNSGSFFKNPVISEKDFQHFITANPNAPFYKAGDNYKIPAGWLIEQCGFKGKRFGDAGVHAKQALVLVNHGEATGKEIFELSQKIQQTVFENFGIKIETEVNII
ncbi:MAG: UDP-N-acetylmuramate dehydrogenase [Flavobacteriaceae bacterium]|nr:UDP-N-acetylmuramate dehydrogenase [Flavobacteriaceae bacterium]